MRDQLTVLIVDDHPLVREALIHHLRRIAKRIEVTEASTFAELEKTAGIEPMPDLITLDLEMPGVKGPGALIWVRERFPQVPVAVVSGSVDFALVREAFRLGAAGFIPKTMMGTTLVTALSLVLDGQKFFPAEMLSDIGVSSSPEATSAPHAAHASPASRLSQRQIEVLTALIEGKSNKEIARALGVEEITIKVHLQAIFRKLGVSNRVQAVRKAIELGLDHGARAV